MIFRRLLSTVAQKTKKSAVAITKPASPTNHAPPPPPRSLQNILQQSKQLWKQSLREKQVELTMLRAEMDALRSMAASSLSTTTTTTTTSNTAADALQKLQEQAEQLERELNGKDANLEQYGRYHDKKGTPRW